jgi:hypothetical protein
MAHGSLTLLFITTMVAFAAPAHALSLQDEKLSLNFKLIFQNRGTMFLDAADADGNSYDPIRGTSGEPERLRFDLRPIRFGMSIKYGEHWKGFIMFRSEKLDLNNPAAFTRLLHVFLANAEFAFKTGSLEHAFHFGLDKAWSTESNFPAWSNLFPSDRIVSVKSEVRGVGVGYMMRGSFFNLGLDVQNNNTGVKDKQASNLIGAEDNNGLFYSGRLEVAPKPQWLLAKKIESYAGEKGTGLVAGFDMQVNNKNLDDDKSDETFTRSNMLTFGPDLLLHWDGLSTIAEFRWRRTMIDVVPDIGGAATSTTSKGIFWGVQAGYAIPLGDPVLEPALGYSQLDNDVDIISTPVYGGGTDNGPDGSTFTAGLNLYFDGHANKLQLAYQHWRAEGGHGRADIIRLQHQISF